MIDRQQFEVVVHAKMGARPFAKERIPPYRYEKRLAYGVAVVLVRSSKNQPCGAFFRHCCVFLSRCKWMKTYSAVLDR